MATITVTPGQVYGPTDTVTSTDLNDLGSPTAAIDTGTIVNADISASADIDASKLAINVFSAAYPVGSVYMNASDSTNPATLLGFGTWVAFGAGRVPVGIDSGDTAFDTAEETGGAKTHPLTEAELAQHHHLAAVDGFVAETGNVTSSNAISETATQSGSTNQSYAMRPATTSTYGNVGRTSQVGNGDAHNNLQPYIVVHMWKRTA
jgi:hypothetical protein